nr:putative nitrogen fixation protein NifT [uncultured Rhodopila sp.]
MKVMVRQAAGVLSIYVPKKDLEEVVVEKELETIWGGWVRLKNGWVLEMPAMETPPRLPITVNARKRGEED